MPNFVSFDRIEEACWSDNYEKFAYKTNGNVYIRNTEDLLLTKIEKDFPSNFKTSKNETHFNVKISDDKKSIILTTDTNNTEKSFFCSKEITCYNISEDNETLILGTTSGKIYFYDIQTKKELGSTPPLKSSGTQRYIDAISVNSNKSRLLVTQNNNLYFLQLEDLLYSSDSQIELKVNDFTIPFDTKDVAALKNNYVKEFEIKEVAKVIENTPPDFIKSEITKEDATLKLQKEESNKKTNILEKEVIIEDKSEFDYTQKQEKVEQKTYIQKDDKQNSSTLITEIIPQQTEKLEQKQIKETEEIQNKKENLVTEFVKPDLPKTTQIAQTTKKSQSNKTEKFPQENQKDYKKSDNENRPIIVVNNTTDSNLQQNTKDALNNQKSDENLDKPQQSQKKDKDKDKDKKEFSRQKQFIVIGATAGTAPKPFNFAVGLNVGYENFKLIYPFYFGALIKPKIAFSSPENFPYHYKTQKGDNFLIPSLINAQLMAEIGYCLATKKDLDILISLCLGANASTIWNINFASSVASQFYFSFCTEANVGVAYKNCYATINASYDAMLGFSFGGGLGFSIKLGK